MVYMQSKRLALLCDLFLGNALTTQDADSGLKSSKYQVRTYFEEIS